MSGLFCKDWKVSFLLFIPQTPKTDIIQLLCLPKTPNTKKAKTAEKVYRNLYIVEQGEITAPKLHGIPQTPKAYIQQLLCITITTKATLLRESKK